MLGTLRRRRRDSDGMGDDGRDETNSRDGKEGTRQKKVERWDGSPLRAETICYLYDGQRPTSKHSASQSPDVRVHVEPERSRLADSEAAEATGWAQPESGVVWGTELKRSLRLDSVTGLPSHARSSSSHAFSALKPFLIRSLCVA